MQNVEPNLDGPRIELTYQQSAQLGPPLLRGLVQGGEAPLVRRVDHGAEPDEERGDVEVAVGGGVVERDEATLGFC